MRFAYHRNATRAELMELARELSPLEAERLPEGVPAWRLGAAFISAAARARTYSAFIGGRLAGICFVEDLADRREMAFTKTRYLTERRRIAFARGIGRLLRDLAAMERMAGRDRKPMYMHTPEGDARSKEWFLRAGCVEEEGRGLRCPDAPEEGKEA